MEFRSFLTPHTYALVVYLVVLLYGLNFISSALSLGLFDSSLLLVALIVLLPGVIEGARLATRENFGAEHRKWFYRFFYLTTIIATVFVIIFIIPIMY